MNAHSSDDHNAGRDADPPNLFSIVRRTLHSSGPTVAVIATIEAAFVIAMIVVSTIGGEWTNPSVSAIVFWGALGLSLVAIAITSQVRQSLVIPVAILGTVGLVFGPEYFHAQRALILAATLATLLAASSRTDTATHRLRIAALAVGTFTGVAAAIRVITLLPDGPIDHEAWIYQGLISTPPIAAWAWLPITILGALALRMYPEMRIPVALLIIPMVAALTVLTDTTITPVNVNRGVVATAFTIGIATLVAAALIATAMRQSRSPHTFTPMP